MSHNRVKQVRHAGRTRFHSWIDSDLITFILWAKSTVSLWEYYLKKKPCLDRFLFNNDFENTSNLRIIFILKTEPSGLGNSGFYGQKYVIQETMHTILMTIRARGWMKDMKLADQSPCQISLKAARIQHKSLPSILWIDPVKIITSWTLIYKKTTATLRAFITFFQNRLSLILVTNYMNRNWMVIFPKHICTNKNSMAGVEAKSLFWIWDAKNSEQRQD